MTNFADSSQASKDRLVADLKQMIADAEELLQATAHQTEGKVADLRSRISDNLRSARSKLADAEQALESKARDAAKATDNYVHENPWKSIGAVAGIALLVGVLIGRR